MRILLLDFAVNHVETRLVLESIPLLSKSDSTESVTDWQHFCFLMTNVFIGVVAYVYCVQDYTSKFGFKVNSMVASDCNNTIELIELIRNLTADVH